MLRPNHLLPVQSSSQLPSLALPCLVLPCLASPLPAVTLRWLAVGLPLRDCRLRSRYTQGRLGFFNSPCLALPCLALPCLALPCLASPLSSPLSPLLSSMTSRSTRQQVALGATAPVGSFDRGWGFLKVCSPSPCPLFFYLALVLFSFIYLRQGRMPPLP